MMTQLECINLIVKFKITMLKSGLCNGSDACIFVKETTTITRGPTAADKAAKQLHKRNKEAIFNNCAPLTDCISEINNT